VGYVAYGSQGAILVGYLMVMCIHLFSALEEEDNSELLSKILGFDSLDSLVAATVVTMIAFFSWFVVFVAYQAMINSDLQQLQLKESRRPPDLSLRKHMFYHLFLSHIWSSGQGMPIAHLQRLCPMRALALIVHVPLGWQIKWQS
jgi:hypothetical protein